MDKSILCILHDIGIDVRPGPRPAWCGFQRRLSALTASMMKSCSPSSKYGCIGKADYFRRDAVAFTGSPLPATGTSDTPFVGAGAWRSRSPSGCRVLEPGGERLAAVARDASVYWAQTEVAPSITCGTSAASANLSLYRPACFRGARSRPGKSSSSRSGSPPASCRAGRSCRCARCRTCRLPWPCTADRSQSRQFGVVGEHRAAVAIAAERLCREKARGRRSSPIVPTLRPLVRCAEALRGVAQQPQPCAAQIGSMRRSRPAGRTGRRRSRPPAEVQSAAPVDDRRLRGLPDRC